MPRMYDDRGVHLFLCIQPGCFFIVQEEHEKCPECGSADPSPSFEVGCAEIDHNSPDGCGNKNCWKHKETKCKSS